MSATSVSELRIQPYTPNPDIKKIANKFVSRALLPSSCHNQNITLEIDKLISKLKKHVQQDQSTFQLYLSCISEVESINEFQTTLRAFEHSSDMIFIAALMKYGIENKFIETKLVVHTLFIARTVKLPQEILEDLAKTVFEHDPKGLPAVIQYFMIEDYNLRFQLAKKLVSIAPRELASYVLNFCLDHASAIEIAQEISKVDPLAVVSYIKNFNISDELVLEELAQNSMQANPVETTKLLYNCGIKNKIALARLLTTALAYDLPNVITMMGYFDLTTTSMNRTLKRSNESNFNCHLMELGCKLVCSNKNWETHLLSDQAKRALFQFGKNIGIDLTRIYQTLITVSAMDEKKQIQQQLVNLKWILHSIFMLKLHPGISQNLRERGIFFKKILEKCAAIHRPRLRSQIITMSLVTLNDDVTFALFQQRCTRHAQEHLFLPLVCTYGLFAQKQEMNSFLQFVIEANLDLKDAHFRNPFYDLLHYLFKLQLPYDQLETICNVLTQANYEKNSSIHLMQLFRNVGELGGSTALSKINANATRQEIEHLFFSLFQNIIPIMGSNSFEKDFLTTFGSSRDPFAVVRYAVSLQNGPKGNSAVAILAKYVETVLSETYIETRYDIERNPHLKRIHDSCPELLPKWKEEYTQGFILDEHHYVFTIKDDPYDILLSGNDVKTCLSIEIGNERNYGLLGCLLDGKIRYATIKNKAGKVLARSFLYLLWDVIKNSPIVFIADVFAKNAQQNLERMLRNQIATWVTNKVNLPCAIEGSVVQNKNVFLKSWGSWVQFEYNEGLKDIAENGKYEFNGTYLTIKKQ